MAEGVGVAVGGRVAVLLAVDGAVALGVAVGVTLAVVVAGAVRVGVAEAVTLSVAVTVAVGVKATVGETVDVAGDAVGVTVEVLAIVPVADVTSGDTGTRRAVGASSAGCNGQEVVRAMVTASSPTDRAEPTRAERWTRGGILIRLSRRTQIRR